jgi:2-phospho-L-lactate guanylyltransferase
MKLKYTALIPVKTLALAKSRLAAHLSQAQRTKLVLDMLQHVVLTLSDSDIFEQIYVVSADPQVLELVQQWGAEPLRETQQGHNPALQAAALTIVERAAWRHGAYSTWSRFHTQRMPTQDQSKQNTPALLEGFGLLTISADLPLLTQADIHALIAQAERAQIVLAGSSDHTGTNAILMRPPAVVPYLFGPNSLPTYVQAARKRQVSYTLLENANLALDIDTIDDLRMLEQRSRAWSGMASLAI